MLTCSLAHLLCTFSFVLQNSVCCFLFSSVPVWSNYNIMKSVWPILSFFLTGSLALIGPKSNVDTICTSLKSKYPDLVLWDPLNINSLGGPVTTQWLETSTDYWNAANINNRASCILYPNTTALVSEAVKQLNVYNDVPFAVKSGGHQFNFGHSSVNKGVLISFNEKLSSTVRSPDGKSFVVGSGARWGSVYTETHKTQQIVVGGRLSDVGVGGLLLGGGLSYYSAQYGMACDNVINYEVVLPNGTITNANANENADLWWALKGGGNRFAIVTRFTLKAYPEGVNGQVWGGSRTYDITKRAALYDAATKFTRDYPDKKAAIIITFEHGFTVGIATFVLMFFFYDGPTPPPNVFADFDAISHLSSSTKTGAYPEIADSPFSALRGFASAARVSTHPNLQPKSMSKLYDQYYKKYATLAVSNTLRNIDLQILSWAIQPMPVAIAQASQNAGGNPLGLRPEHGDRVWMEHVILWLNQLCNKNCPGYQKTVVEELDTFEEETFRNETPTNYKSGDLDMAKHTPLFMNDANADQDVYGSYGTVNEQRLLSIQSKYDPKGFMFRQQGWVFT